MKNLFTCLSKKSLSNGNGSGMDRECIGDESALSKKLFVSILFLLLLGVGNAWADATVGTTLFSENFGDYSAEDVPSGSVSSVANKRTIYGSGSVTYTSVNGSYTSSGKTKTAYTRIYEANLAGGTSPELLVGKNAGTFTITGIPTGNATGITLTYMSNKNPKLSSSTTDVSFSSTRPTGTEGAHSVTITIPSNTATFNLTFTAPSENARLDNILMVVETAGGGGGSVAVTGVSVAPTTKSIIPGETFTITPTVSPADATDKSVSWASTATSYATVNSSGLVTGVAAGPSTVRCTTTDGSFTADCAVTVRGVTLQARDEDGNTIAAGGPGAPSRSGTTITAAANSGNYVFKQWDVTNATAASTSTSPTTISNPTGAVTVTAVYYKPITITYKANGSTFTTQTYARGGTLAFPASNPNADTYSCTGKTFMGWVAEANKNYSHATTAPTYASAGGSVTAAANYYAVFAEATPTNDYKQITAEGDLVAGAKYLIVGNSSSTYNALPVDAASNLTSVSPSSSTITTTTAAIIWTLEGSADAWKIKSTSNSKYLQIHSGTLSFQNSTSYTFSVSVSSSKFAFTTSSTATGNKILSYYHSEGCFNAYSSSNNVYIYKQKITYANYDTRCAETYTVTKGTESGGTFTVSPTTAAEDVEITLSATPSADYRFDEWVITNTSTTADVTSSVNLSGQTASATFDMPAYGVTVTPSFVAKCQTPTFSVSAGTYNNDQTVTISCATGSATIKYTLDGSDPATYGTTYSGAITIDEDNTTLKAVAIKASHENSEVASATYRLKCATPTFTASPGLVGTKYLGTQTVTPASTTTGSVTFYYTTDGGTPTTGSTEYSDGIEVSSTATVKAIATKSGYQNSDVGSASYTITAAHTVTWMNQNDAVNPLKTERVENGAAPAAFPTESKSGCNSYTYFYGWAEDNFTTPVTNPNSSSTIKVYRSASELPNSSSDVTYYAVWADAAPGWSKASSISAGDVVIIVNETNSREIKSLSTSSSHADTAIYATSPRGVCPFTVVAASTSGFLFKTSDNKYATAGSGNYLYKTEITALSPENDDQRWTVTFDNGDARILNTGYDTRYIRYNSAQPRFAAYAKTDANPYGTQNPVQLYKHSDVDCVTKCCTPLDDLNETHSETYNSVTLTWDDIDNVSSWAVTGVDGSSTAVPAGDIGTPTDGGSTYSCVISNLSQYTDYTFTITATPASGYCDKAVDVEVKTPCVAPSSLSISSTGSKWDFCAGESMTLTVSGTNVSASATYQWQKHNGSAWVDIDGANSASYTVASMAASNAGQYCCIVTNPGSSCDATTSGVWVRLWQLYINNGTADAWQSLDFSNTGTGTGSNTTVYLASDKGYQFKLINNNGGYFGNDGTITTNASNWIFDGSEDDNCKITSGLEGNYTFAINYTNKDYPTISVTYPVGNQPASRKIWFDKSVITGWTDAGTSDLCWRIGKKSNSLTNKDATANAFTLVPGTDRFYVYETKAYDGFEAWHVANNVAWSGDSDNDPGYDNHGIYTHYHDQSSTDVKYATVYQKYVIGTSGVTLVPTTKKNTDWYCDFWNVDKYDGMLTHNAEITSYSHGTVTVAYTNTSDEDASFTSGNVDLAHRCILTITAVADAGYSLTSLQVNSEDFDSGDDYILSDDATITAVFTAQTSTVTLKPNGGSGSDQTVTATYDASMPGKLSGGGDIVKPSRDYYSFTGYFDNTSGGTQYYTSTLTSAKIWDKTGAQNLYAQWQGDSYTITFKDKGNNAYSGSNGGSLPTSHTYGAATALVDGVKTGYHFDGWFTDASCTAGNEISTIGATAITANTTYYAKWTIENYSVTWKVNGENYTTGTPSDNADYNTKVSTLPTAPSAPEGCSDKVFKGWSVNNLGKTTGQSAPADLFTTAEGSPAITDDVIFYAVFADETPESSTTTWTKKTYTQLSEAGTYIIIDNADKAFTGSISSGKGSLTASAFSFTDGVATSVPDGAQELTFTMPTANQFTISKTVTEAGVPVTYYLYATAASSGKLAWTSTSGDLDGNYWTNKNTSGTVTTLFRYSKLYTDKYAHMRSNDNINTYGDAASYSAVHFVKKGTAVTPASWSNYVTLCDEPAECGTPTFSVEEGTYTETQTVTISTVTDGATIRYTTDGTDPTSSSGTVYSEPVEVSCTTTLKAIAYKAGREDSDVGSVDITIKVPNPTFSINSGTYYAVQNVTLSCDMAGATIYYETTNDGTDPTTPTSSSTEYTGAINIPANSTIKVSAIAIKDGCATASDVVTKTYVVRIGTNYTLVTDVNDLYEGDKVVIVADNGSTRNAVNSYAGGNDRPSTNDFDFANNERTAVTVYPLKVGDTYTVQVFELQGGPGAWVFKAVTDDTKKYLGLKEDNTYLKTYVDNTDNQTKWSISISTGIAHITNNQYTSRYIEYNSSGSKFACYTSNQTARTKLYSVPTTDPTIKVEASLSAFTSCAGNAGTYQSFYVSGKNLTGNMDISGPTGYEFCSTSGGTYTSMLELTPLTGTVTRQLVYVRLAASATSGDHNGNINVAVSANSLSKNVAITGSATTSDSFVDMLHSNATTYWCGSYDAPDLSDETEDTSGTCEEVHYKFLGWVAESDLTSLTSDGAYKSALVKAGDDMTATGTTYYAVWGELE